MEDKIKQMQDAINHCRELDNRIMKQDPMRPGQMVRKEEQEMCRECIKKVLEWYSFGVIVGVGFYIGLTFAVQVLKAVTDVMRQWCL